MVGAHLCSAEDTDVTFDFSKDTQTNFIKNIQLIPSPLATVQSITVILH